jgi:hypothetical protein
VLAIIFGIITSYSYVFFSSYLYVFLGIGALVSIALKEYAYVRRCLGILAGILIGASPFWYSVFSFQDDELQQMSWMRRSHAPIMSVQTVFILLICGVILYFLMKGSFNRLSGIVSLALLLSGIICINQQVLTGMAVQPGHYINYVIPQSMIFACALLAAELVKNGHLLSFYRRLRDLTSVSISTLCMFSGSIVAAAGFLLYPSHLASYINPNSIFGSTTMFTSLLNKGPLYGIVAGMIVLVTGLTLKYGRFPRRSIRLKTILYIGISLYAVLNAGVIQFVWYQGYIKNSYGVFQQLAPALQWLNTNTEKESVILASFDYMPCGNSMDNVITIYTHNNVYASYHAQFYTIPPLDEIIDRVYMMMFFMGITQREHVEKILEDMTLPGSFEEYQNKRKKDLYSELRIYRIDYFFYGPREKELFKVNPETEYPFLHQVYDDGIVKIFRIL